MDVAISLQEKILIDSPLVQIGFYKCALTKQIELTHEFITLPLDRGKETLLLSLSFKHITKVEFLDNSEGDGAGLVLFVNDFMAKKIQVYIDKGGTGFTNFVLESYSNNKLVVIDIQNNEPTFFNQIRSILHEANAYHRKYVIQLMNRSKRLIDYHVSFIDVISFSQWQTLNKLMANARAGFMPHPLKGPVEISIVDNNNQNGFCPPQLSPNSTRSSDNSGTSHLYQPLPSECHQQRVEVDQLQKRTLQLPPYAVMAVPLLTQPTPVVTIRDSQSPPAVLTVPTLLPPPSSVVHVVPSRLSPTLSVPLPHSLIQQEPVEFFQNEQHLYVQQQKEHQPKSNTDTLGQTTIAQYLELEPSDAKKFMPRTLKLKNQSINHNAKNNIRSSLLTLPFQTSPSTSQEQQLSPKSQNRSDFEPRAGVRAVKVAKREREVHLIDDEESELEVKSVGKRSNDTLFSFPPTGRDSCSVHYADLKYLSRNFMLNDTIIDFYLKYIHHCLVPQERRANIFIFNSFFFGRLTQPPPGGKLSNLVTLTTKIRRVISNFQRVKNWTKTVNLFDMDYIVVPINEDIHWYLAIIVNIRHCICTQQTNESVNPNLSKNAAKCVSPSSYLIVLNSLIDPAEDKHLAVRDQLAEYLYLEYADKHCRDSGTFFNKQMIDVVVPTMLPQQKNFIDCGLFLLHFAQLFLTNPPKFISKSSSFRRWYPNFEIKHKRDELRSVIRLLASHIKASDFVQLPTPRRNNKNVGRRSQAEKMQLIMEGMVLMGRTRRYSDSDLDSITKDEYFSCLYRPRSLDSLIRENREKPLVLQPPTISEMSRFKQPRRVRQEIFAISPRQGQI